MDISLLRTQLTVVGFTPFAGGLVGWLVSRVGWAGSVGRLVGELVVLFAVWLTGF